MRPLRIALGDLSYINAENSANSNVGWQSNLYVPLNIGYIASYTKKRFGNDVEIRLFKDPERIIQYARDSRPDLVGLSAYYWSANLNDIVARKIKATCSAKIVYGGPSIDTDPQEKENYLARHPVVDVAIPNEGEEGFAAVVESMLGGADLSRTPRGDNQERDGLILARPPGPVIPIGLKTDLDELPSPYLTGLLDEFMDGPFQPMIQTSRLCPYTCSFCVSGKNRGKLRAFNLDQVQEELKYIGSRFNDRREHVLHIVDENFGILARDVEVARVVRSTSEKFGYPAKIFFYNDKRFTQIARDVHEVVKGMVYHGVCLSLQSENPETLKAIKRRNLTDEQVVSAIGWSHDLGVKTSTELIFGLPMETRASFLALLDKCARLGFDSILCYNLIIFDGIEMNRAAYRREHKLRTMRRLMHGNAGWVDGELAVESEEVVVESSTFGPDDYRFFRALNTLFHAIFVNGMHREFFRAMVARGESLTAFLGRFLDPMDGDDDAATMHRGWLADLNGAIDRELFLDEDIDDLVGGVRRGDMSLPTEIKIQPIFARRLSDNANGWVAEIMTRMTAKVFEEVAA